MSKPLRVIQYGLGPIGSAVACLLVKKESLDLVGAVDIDPDKIGRDVGEVIDFGRPLGFSTVKSLAEALDQSEAEVVIHTTSSYFDLFTPQILEILEAGLDVVSTAEELAFPWLDHAQEASEIDEYARRAGKTVLGTGVNPGFLMDSLPLFLTAICQEVDHISVTRAIDASTRRQSFQAKIGSDLSVAEFNAKMELGRMGHVGLPESMAMLFHTLGKSLVGYESSVEPVVAERLTRTDYFEVPAGKVIGLKQVATGFGPDGELAALTFLAALTVAEEGDTIQIKGSPDLEIKLLGTNGDLATVAIAVNAVPRVYEAEPGLKTMMDLPIITVF